MSAVQLPAQAWQHHRVTSVRGNRTFVGVVSSIWRRRSLRWQMLAIFLLINLIAAAATASLVIFNAKRATEAEIAASITMAEHFVRASVDNLDRTIPGGLFLEDLAGSIGPLRHVRLLVSTVGGKPVWQARALPGAIRANESSAPRWFASLVRVSNLSHEVPVLSAGRRIGTVWVIGEPSDEIAEVCSDMSDLAVVAALVDLSVILVLYFAFGRVLTPLSELSEGLRQLEHGHLHYRLAEPKTHELAGLSHRFNALAGALGVAQTENIRLNRCLVTAQEDERQLIAKELHDELGRTARQHDFARPASRRISRRPGTSLPRACRTLIRDRRAHSDRQSPRSATAETDDARRHAARRYARRARAEFARHDGAPDIALVTRRLTHSYGDCVDLTIYRCVQEGLTNALRHSHGTSVHVTIEESVPHDAGMEGKTLRLVLLDDGNGIAGTPPGMGLTGMKERVQALGGSFTISPRPTGGTCLEVVLPAEAHDGLRLAIL